jgi:hypothetical protein
MDTRSGWHNRGGEGSQAMFTLGISAASILFSMQYFGLFNVLAATAGRMHLKFLSQKQRDVSKKDATVSQIFVYPGRLLPEGYHQN